MSSININEKNLNDEVNNDKFLKIIKQLKLIKNMIYQEQDQLYDQIFCKVNIFFIALLNKIKFKYIESLNEYRKKLKKYELDILELMMENIVLKIENNFLKDKKYNEGKKTNELNLKTVLNKDEFTIYKFLMLDKYEKEIPFLTGCTACVCVIDTLQKKAYFANSGDSRAIIIKKNNEIKQITKDHKPDDANEKERIYNAEGCVNDNRVDGILNLSRTIGDLKYKNNKKFAVDKQKIICTPDLYEENLKDIQYIVIGCDGIYDCMSNNGLCLLY